MRTNRIGRPKPKRTSIGEPKPRDRKKELVELWTSRLKSRQVGDTHIGGDDYDQRVVEWLKGTDRTNDVMNATQ